MGRRIHYGNVNDKNYGDLVKAHPMLFEFFLDNTCIGIPTGMIECEIGWWFPLERLCDQLEMLNIEYGRKYGIYVRAFQVKEKFGTLRFYYDLECVGASLWDRIIYKINKAIRRLSNNKLRWRIITSGDVDQVVYNYLDAKVEDYISEAEDNCYRQCEKCGAPIGIENSPRYETSGWITYVCGKCYKERMNGKDPNPEDGMIDGK